MADGLFYFFAQQCADVMNSIRFWVILKLDKFLKLEIIKKAFFAKFVGI
ncbi:hypothetical protein KIS4809_2728 [Bacillus sp. ZZV12-4809]|nr:hypothetical protein KIS4809_2728 [Bacillus sp. ZZV12-4809]